MNDNGYIPYDEEKYLTALTKKKSPLIKLLGARIKDCQASKDALVEPLR
jgi:hypothetical protein